MDLLSFLIPKSVTDSFTRTREQKQEVDLAGNLSDQVKGDRDNVTKNLAEQAKIDSQNVINSNARSQIELEKWETLWGSKVEDNARVYEQFEGQIGRKQETNMQPIIIYGILGIVGLVIIVGAIALLKK